MALKGPAQDLSAHQLRQLHERSRKKRKDNERAGGQRFLDAVGTVAEGVEKIDGKSGKTKERGSRREFTCGLFLCVLREVHKVHTCIP